MTNTPHLSAIRKARAATPALSLPTQVPAPTTAAPAAPPQAPSMAAAGIVAPRIDPQPQPMQAPPMQPPPMQPQMTQMTPEMMPPPGSVPEHRLDADGVLMPPGHSRNPNYVAQADRPFDPDDPLGQVRLMPQGQNALWKVRVTSAPGVQATIRGPAKPADMTRGGIVARDGSAVRVAAGGPSAPAGLFSVVSETKPSGIKVTSGPNHVPGSTGIRIVEPDTPVPTGSTVVPPPVAAAPVMAPPVAAPVAPSAHGAGAIPSIKTDPESPVAIMLSTAMRSERMRQQLAMIARQTAVPYDVEVFVAPGHGPLDEAALGSIPGTVHRPKHDRGHLHGPWMRFVHAQVMDAPYIAILDDDAIPSPQWLEAAVTRIHQFIEQGMHVVIAAAGIRYKPDSATDPELVGFESPNAEEVEVDVGRGGWVMSKALLAEFCDFTERQRAHERGWATHLASVVQHLGGVTLVLPYDAQRTTWGMLTPPQHQGSISQLFDMAAQTDPTMPSAAQVAQDVYAAYRSIGWAPLCMQTADGEAAESVAAVDEPPPDAEEIPQERIDSGLIAAS